MTTTHDHRAGTDASAHQANQTQEHTPLAPDDLARVRRLREEVKSRLYEIGLIMGRTMGHEVLPETAQLKTERSALDDGQTIEVVIVMLPDGTFCCSQDPPGECICPC